MPTAVVNARRRRHRPGWCLVWSHRYGTCWSGTTVSSLGLIERVVAGELSTVVDSLVGHTTVLPFGAPYTRFNGRLGPERAVCAGSWAKKRIQAVQRAADVTANDVITAIVAGVMRHWLRDRGELPKNDRLWLSARSRCVIGSAIRQVTSMATCSVSGCARWGTNVDDPVARLDVIHRSMAEGKHWVAKRDRRDRC